MFYLLYIYCKWFYNLNIFVVLLYFVRLLSSRTFKKINSILQVSSIIRFFTFILNKFLNPYKNYILHNFLLNKDLSIDNFFKFKELYFLFNFFYTNKIFINSFLFIKKILRLQDDFFNFFLIFFFIYKNFNKYLFTQLKTKLLVFCSYKELLFICFFMFNDFVNKNISNSKFISFKSFSHIFSNLKYLDNCDFSNSQKKFYDVLGKNDVFVKNFNTLNTKIKNINYLNFKNTFFKDRFIEPIIKKNYEKNKIFDTNDIDNLMNVTPKISCSQQQKNIQILQLNHNGGMFVRKHRVFNKGRYSRNRQNYRTGVYWCLYVNIFAVLGLYFFFYKFTINFGYLWWFLFIFFGSFIWNKLLKFKLYKCENQKKLLIELFYFYKILTKEFIEFSKDVLLDIFEIIYIFIIKFEVLVVKRDFDSIFVRINKYFIYSICFTFKCFIYLFNISHKDIRYWKTVKVFKDF